MLSGVYAIFVGTGVNSVMTVNVVVCLNTMW